MKSRILILSAIFVAVLLTFVYLVRSSSSKPVRIGILHSLTGTMAISERSVVDAILLAVAELNEKGGVSGRRIEPVIADGASNERIFAKEAERLIVQEKVSTIFGCWTSASRKTVKPVVERYNHLLVYPLQYEGLEQSPNIIYTGASPNQQIIPAVKWSLDHLGKKAFLVGSDYIFPRVANAIIRDQMTSLGGEIVGEEYLALGSQEIGNLPNRILESGAELIFNSINGDTNVVFFNKLREAGILSARVPAVSFSIAEEELRVMNAEHLAGDYAVWNYFQSIRRPENREFVERFKKKYGAHRVTDDPIEAAYFGVYLWAQATEDAGSFDVSAIRKAFPDQSLNAPEGIVYVDPDTLHTWKTVRVGKIRRDGQFDIVWDSENPIRPIPFPKLRSRKDWESFLNDLYTRWGQKWSKPANAKS